MIDRGRHLSDHFTLGELVPASISEEPPPEILANLEMLCADLLEPVRAHFGAAVHIHSGWRPEEYNAAHGGVPTSDHPAGRAGDFHVEADKDRTWEENTIEAFHWLIENRVGHYGQLILEDHRATLKDPGKLWVHAAIPSPKHPGVGADLNRILVSHAPKQYAIWTGQFA